MGLQEYKLLVLSSCGYSYKDRQNLWTAIRKIIKRKSNSLVAVGSAGYNTIFSDIIFSSKHLSVTLEPWILKKSLTLCRSSPKQEHRAGWIDFHFIWTAGASTWAWKRFPTELAPCTWRSCLFLSDGRLNWLSQYRQQAFFPSWAPWICKFKSACWAKDLLHNLHCNLEPWTPCICALRAWRQLSCFPHDSIKHEYLMFKCLTNMCLFRRFLWLNTWPHSLQMICWLWVSSCWVQ